MGNEATVACKSARVQRLLEDSAKRVRISRGLQDGCRKSVHDSREAVSRSRVLLQQSRPVELCSCEASDSEPVAIVPDRPPPEGLLEVVAGRSFRNERVVLDGRHFRDCELVDCTVQYGGNPVILETTRLEGCNFQFEGYAAMTIQLLETFDMLPGGTIQYAHLPGTAATPLSSRPN